MSQESENAAPADGSVVPRALLFLRSDYVAPRTATETALAEIWREALAMDRVGIEDDYRDLGGDSLLAALIFASIERRLGIAMPTSSLIKAWTIAALARKIDAARTRGAA